MGFTAKQTQALQRGLSSRRIRTREANGRELSYIEGWYAISEANRIFGFDAWSRETMDSRCVLTRENRGSFLAIYVAKVRITVHADGVTIIREGHGTGEGRGTSPGEVHDTALKAAETDATKRALATFGRPFGLELYRKDKNAVSASSPTVRSTAVESPPTQPRFGLHPDDYNSNPEAVALLRPAPPWLNDRPPTAGSGLLVGLCHERIAAYQDRQKSACDCRTQTIARQGTPEIRCLTALPHLWPAAVRSPSPAVCTAESHWSQGER